MQIYLNYKESKLDTGNLPRPDPRNSINNSSSKLRDLLNQKWLAIFHFVPTEMPLAIKGPTAAAKPGPGLLLPSPATTTIGCSTVFL